MVFLEVEVIYKLYLSFKWLNAEVSCCQLAYIMKLMYAMSMVFVRCDACLSAEGRNFRHL